MIKAPQDTLHGKMMRPFYVRRKIFLKDTPSHAKLQFTADDYSQVVINGKDAAFSNSWRETVVCDVGRFLKKGENVLGFQYYNKDTWGGVFGELYIQYPDGSSEKISTDGKFKSTDKEVRNWASAAVDDTLWDNVIEQPGPPNKIFRKLLTHGFPEKISNGATHSVFRSSAKANALKKGSPSGVFFIPVTPFSGQIQSGFLPANSKRWIQNTGTALLTLKSPIISLRENMKSDWNLPSLRSVQQSGKIWRSH